MSNVEVIRGYFEEFFSGLADHSAVRRMLADDFIFRDPLMSADSADEYITQLKALGNELEMYAEVRQLIGEKDQVAALVDFQGPAGPITYAQWFTFKEGKIASLEVVYDPRAFLNVEGQ